MHARSTLALALLVIAAAGCRARASKSPDGPERSGAAEGEAWPSVPTEGFAVLPWGAPVYLEPSFGGPSARLGWWATSLPPWPSTGQVVRVVGSRDGFVEIAPLPWGGTPHCGPILDGDVFDLRLYASPWSLSSVLVRPFEQVDDEGRVLALRPGAVVQPLPDDPQGRFAVAAGGILVIAPLPADAVSTTYDAPQPRAMPDRRLWQLPHGLPMVHGGWPVELDQVFGGDVAVEDARPNAEGVRLELVSPCAKVTAQAERMPEAWPEDISFEFGLGGPDVVVPAGVPVHVGAPSPEPPPEPPPEPIFHFPDEGELLGELALVGVVRPEWAFEQGAPIYLSPAGSAAGTLSALRVFNEDGWMAGERLCFQTAFGSRFVPSLGVCLDAAEGRLRNPQEDAHDFRGELVVPAEVRVAGALPVEDVERVLRVHRHQLRRCAFEATLQGHPIRGELALGLDVSGTGAVTRVQLRSAKMGTVTDCALAAARGWTFPATRHGTPVRIEFSVKLGGG